VPLAYYHPSGPLARGIALARAAAGGPRGALRVGVVGLGTGALACYAQPGDRWRFYEIDPAVARIATTPAYFRYLSACLPEPDIVLGDARLTLAREPAAAFDYLVIDAFSSDSIPVHLLTIEAFRLYLARLSDRGLLALHISNQNLDLPPVIEANVAALGLKGVYAEGEFGQGALASQVILVSRQEETLSPALAWHKARRLGAAPVKAWTDDYSDILSAVTRRLRSKLSWMREP
jgi:spermidine synthase